MDDGIGEASPLRWFTTGANRWREGAEWPPPGTEEAAWYLHSHGRANRDDDAWLDPEPPGDEPPDRFEYDPREPAPSLGGNLSSRLITTHAQTPMRGGPVEQAPLERRPDVLVYTSRELERDLEVTGPVEVVLYAESSARDTDFVARVTDVDPAGGSFVLTEGILRARYRGGLERTELLEPNEATGFRIRLYPMSHVFRAGHRIRLQVTSSCFPRFSRNLNTGGRRGDRHAHADGPQHGPALGGISLARSAPDPAPPHPAERASQPAARARPAVRGTPCAGAEREVRRASW